MAAKRANAPFRAANVRYDRHGLTKWQMLVAMRLSCPDPRSFKVFRDARAENNLRAKPVCPLPPANLADTPHPDIRPGYAFVENNHIKQLDTTK